MRASPEPGPSDPDRSGVRAELVRAEVRRVATDVFADGAGDAIGLQEVADRVGMSRSALYRYFPSRDALLSDIVIEHSERAARIVSQSVPGTSPDARLHHLVRRLAVFGLEHSPTVRMLDRIWPDLPASARDHVRTLNGSFFASIRGVIVEGMEAGVFREVDPGAAAKLISAMHSSLAVWFDEVRGPLSPAEVADQVATTAVAGLLAPAAAAQGGLRAARESVASARAELDRLDRILSDSPEVAVTKESVT